MTLIYTRQLMHLYIILKKFKMYIKTLKTLIHISIIRSSSGRTHCSLLKSCIKTIVLIYNFGKEQCVFLGDDRMIETCRNVYNSLFKDLALKKLTPTFNYNKMVPFQIITNNYPSNIQLLELTILCVLLREP